MTSDFASWLQKELDERDLTAAKLARITRKDEGIYSRILGRKRQPSPETLQVIAKAFKLPLGQVYQAAGLLPPDEGADEWVEQTSHKIKLIPPSMRPIVGKFIDSMIEGEENNNQAKPKPAKRGVK